MIMIPPPEGALNTGHYRRLTTFKRTWRSMPSKMNSTVAKSTELDAQGSNQVDSVHVQDIWRDCSPSIWSGDCSYIWNMTRAWQWTAYIRSLSLIRHDQPQLDWGDALSTQMLPPLLSQGAASAHASSGARSLCFWRPAATGLSRAICRTSSSLAVDD